jgi:NADH dehydrogenase/NADH:ubiquinone oxidoreductase subunit G
VGALTLKTFSDELREWEFFEEEGFDLTDSFGTNLRLSIRENQIFLAESNEVSMPWITDKGRLFFDGMFNKNVYSYFFSTTLWDNFFFIFLKQFIF